MRINITLAVAWLLVMPGAAARAATVDGATIHWTSTGSGQRTVILVHGWTCDESSWREQVPALAKSYRVITLDLPGHGKSGMPKGQFSMELFARAVEAVRSEAKVDRAVYVGHSMGTPVIRKYALLYPEHVSGLVLADGLVQIPTPGAATPPPIRDTSAAAREKMIRGMFGPATTPALQAHILKMMMGTAESSAAGAMTATWDQSQWSNQPITAPVLALYASRPLATEAAVKTLFPNAEYHQIPETAHFLMMEKPEEFNALLTAFLAKVK